MLLKFQVFISCFLSSKSFWNYVPSHKELINIFSFYIQQQFGRQAVIYHRKFLAYLFHGIVTYFGFRSVFEPKKVIFVHIILQKLFVLVCTARRVRNPITLTNHNLMQTTSAQHSTANILWRLFINTDPVKRNQQRCAI